MISRWRSSPGCRPESVRGPWEPAKRQRVTHPCYLISQEENGRICFGATWKTRMNSSAEHWKEEEENRHDWLSFKEDQEQEMNVLDAEPKGFEETTCCCLCSSFLSTECGARYTLHQTAWERAGKEESVESVDATPYKCQRCSIHRKREMSELVSLSMFSCLCISTPLWRKAPQKPLFSFIQLAWFQLTVWMVLNLTLDPRLVMHHPNQGDPFSHYAVSTCDKMFTDANFKLTNWYVLIKSFRFYPDETIHSIFNKPLVTDLLHIKLFL